MIDTDDALLRVIYFSHQNSDASHDMMVSEIDDILKRSQLNNERSGVTGALIFNAGVFGQILEGPIDAVEETFERIQMDERHDAITVLESSRITERSFPQWSMGFVGSDRVCAELFGEIGSKTAFDISRLSGFEIFETLRALTLKNEISSKAA